MRFTCDKCHGDYQAHKGSAVAHLFIKDHRCNHIEVRCSHCGTTEVIFLGPNRIEEVIRGSDVPTRVRAEADAELRVRAERAWHAADKVPAEESTQEPAALVQPPVEAGEGEAGEVATVQRYDLTQRHEELLESFGKTLESIPDDLLWDGLQSEHDPHHPERWTD